MPIQSHFLFLVAAFLRYKEIYSLATYHSRAQAEVSELRANAKCLPKKKANFNPRASCIYISLCNTFKKSNHENVTSIRVNAHTFLVLVPLCSTSVGRMM